ncbi:hypothetical protein D3C78_1940910 [compost metagenome]
MYADTVSAMVLTVFAPIASRTSTIRWATTMGPRGVLSNTWTSMSLQPPPRPISMVSLALARSMISALFSSTIWRTP